MRLIPMLAGMMLSLVMMANAADSERIPSPAKGEKDIPHYIMSLPAGNIIVTTLRIPDTLAFGFCFSIQSVESTKTVCYHKTMERMEHFKDGSPFLQELYEGEDVDMNGKKDGA